MWGNDQDEYLQAIKKCDCVKQRALAEKTGFDPNIAHIHKEAHFSLLFHASIDNDVEGFKILIGAGADPTWRNKFGTNVFKLLLKRNQVKMAEACFASLDAQKRKDYANQAIPSGWTLLMSCAEAGNLVMAKLLVENGAEVNRAMSSGWAAMHAAAKKGSIEMLEYLLQQGGDPNLKATHRDYGRDVAVSDVTSDQNIIELVNKMKK